jgi:hypothetical protein
MNARFLAIVGFLVAFQPGALAAGLDISFYGKPPEFPAGRRLSVVAGVNAGIPMVFDLSQEQRIVLRPASQSEVNTETYQVYKFEWQKDKSARFYRATPPSVLANLAAANAIDSASPEGRAFEEKLLKNYLQNGAVMHSCLSSTSVPQSRIEVIVVAAPQGSIEQAIVRPEGSLSECILEKAKDAFFGPSPTGRKFTAATEIDVKP